MGRFSDAALNIATFGYHSHRKALQLEQSLKSLRDSSTAGGSFSSSAGSVGVRVVQTGSPDTTRLFRKQNVRMLRSYAEYSVWVRAAIDIYRNTVGQAKWAVTPYDQTKPMDETVAKAIRQLLIYPNQSGKPYPTIKKETIEDYLVLGHGANELALRRDLSPYAIYGLDAARFAFVPGWDGSNPRQPRYVELDETGSKIQRYLPSDMAMVLVNRSRSYDLLGLSHVEVLDKAVRSLLEGDDYLYSQVLQAAPNGALDLGQGVTPDQVAEVRSQIEAVRKAFIVMGGTSGAKYVPFSATSREMQVLDTQVWFVRQVAAIFELPTAKLALAVDTSRANTEAMLTDADSGMGAVLWEVREAENADIVRKFGPVEQHNCYLDYPIMSRRDEQAQANISKIQTGGAAWSSPNEARKAGGLPVIDLPIADEILIPAGPGGPIPLSVLQAKYYDKAGNPIVPAPPTPTAPNQNQNAAQPSAEAEADEEESEPATDKAGEK